MKHQQKAVKKYFIKPLRIILILCTLILVTYLVSEWMPGKKTDSWRKDIILNNEADITAVLISRDDGEVQELSFSSSGSGKWKLASGALLESVHEVKMEQLLQSLKQFSAVKMIPHDSPEFQESQLNTPNAINISTYSGSSIVANFQIGKKVMTPGTSDIYTYFKRSGDRNAYLVTGDLHQIFQLDPAFYIKDLPIDFKYENLVSMTFRFPCDSVITFEKEFGRWDCSYFGMVDTLDIQRVLTSLNRLKPLQLGTEDQYWFDQKYQGIFTDVLELKYEDEVEPFRISRTSLPFNENSFYVFKINTFPVQFFSMENKEARKLFQWNELKTPAQVLAKRTLSDF